MLSLLENRISKYLGKLFVLACGFILFLVLFKKISLQIKFCDIVNLSWISEI